MAELMGRRTKLTPELADILVEAVGLGLDFAEAARIGEISERTLHGWRERGKAEEGSIYEAFTDRIDSVQVSHAQELLEAQKRASLESTTITKTHVRESIMPAVVDENGNIVSPEVVTERVEDTTTETRPPDPKVGQWWIGAAPTRAVRQPY